MSLNAKPSFYNSSKWICSQLLSKSILWKVLSSQQRSWQEPVLNQGILGYTVKIEREEANGWAISECQPWALFSFRLFWAWWWWWCDVVTKDGISSILSSISPEVLLKTGHVSAEWGCLHVWHSAGNSAMRLGTTIQNLAARSCAFCRLWGNGLLISYHLLIFSTCSHISAPLHPVEAGNFS